MLLGYLCEHALWAALQTICLMDLWGTAKEKFEGCVGGLYFE